MMKSRFMNPIMEIKRQKGLATLAISVVLLIGVTLFTLSASRMSSLELNLSNIHESRKTAFNRSDAGVDVLYNVSDSIIDFNDDPGQVYCTIANSKLPLSCDATNITSANNTWPSRWENETHQAQIEIEFFGCPPRSLSTSCEATIFAHFEARSLYDDTANKGGVTETVVGAMTLLPNFR